MPIIECDLEVSPPWFTMPLARQSFEQEIATDRVQGVVDVKAWQVPPPVIGKPHDAVTVFDYAPLTALS